MNEASYNWEWWEELANPPIEYYEEKESGKSEDVRDSRTF